MKESFDRIRAWGIHIHLCNLHTYILHTNTENNSLAIHFLSSIDGFLELYAIFLSNISTPLSQNQTSHTAFRNVSTEILYIILYFVRNTYKESNSQAAGSHSRISKQAGSEHFSCEREYVN